VFVLLRTPCGSRAVDFTLILKQKVQKQADSARPHKRKVTKFQLYLGAVQFLAPTAKFIAVSREISVCSIVEFV